MNVNGIGNGLQHGAAHKVQGPHRDRNQLRTNEAAQPQSGDESKVKGVVRLLQEGHFKGVADVRLRINHFEELSGLDHASLAEAAEDGMPALLDAVNGQLQSLLDSGELTEEQAAGVSEAQALFNTQVEEAVGLFVSEGGSDTSALVQEVQSAFDALADSLSPLLMALEAAVADVVAPAEEAGVTVEATGTLEAAVETAAAEPEAEPAEEAPVESVLDGFLSDLRASFDAALAQYESGLAEASTLPPVSEPTGNGKAYSRFMDEYKDLYGFTSTPTDLVKTETTGIDASA